MSHCIPEEYGLVEPLFEHGLDPPDKVVLDADAEVNGQLADSCDAIEGAAVKDGIQGCVKDWVNDLILPLRCCLQAS